MKQRHSDVRIYEIRRATVSDVEEIAAIEKECFRNPWTAEQLCESLEMQCEYFVATHEGKVVAYAGAQLSDGAYVTNIAVTGAHRRRGLAQDVTEALCDFAKTHKLPFVTLEVRTGNTGAQALYEKMGFENLGVHPGFYTDPKEDAFIFTLEF